MTSPTAAAETEKATPAETVAAQLTGAKRRNRKAPIRTACVQAGTQSAPRPGPLASLISRRDIVSLRLYLLLIALATAPPYTVRRHSNIWARANGLGDDASARAVVSRAWARLEAAKLVSKVRVRRRAQITLLKEDGSGTPYRHPGEHGAGDRYFQLPFEFWLAPEAYYLILSLAEIATLLIALSLPDDFILPVAKAKAWYGLSQSTLERGLKGLEDRGLLRHRVETRSAPRSSIGYVRQNRYTLEAPFGPRGRRGRSGSGGAPVLAHHVGDETR